MENLDLFDELVEAERAVMRAEYTRHHGESSDERVAAIDSIKSAKRHLYSLVDELTPEQGKAYNAHRRWIFTEDAFTNTTD